MSYLEHISIHIQLNFLKKIFNFSVPLLLHQVYNMWIFVCVCTCTYLQDVFFFCKCRS